MALPKNITATLGKKNFEIDYNENREVGGLMFGFSYTNGAPDVRALLQLKPDYKKLRKTAEKLKIDEREIYHLPGAIKCFIKSIKYFRKGYNLIGEWHSHPKQTFLPSTTDNITMWKKAKKTIAGIYYLGIIPGDTGKMRIYKYDRKLLEIPEVLKVD